jgi:small subunit ribosomal protein S21
MFPMRVRVPDQRSFEKALRRFKRECIREGIMADMRKSEFYDKPSVARRRKANRARRRRMRQLSELEGKS